MGGTGYDPARHLVAWEAAVAVDEARRPDDERRVGHHQVEPPSCDRLPHVPGQQLGLDSRQGEGQRGQGEGARVRVRRGDSPAVGGEVQRLDPAAGTDVEG